MDPHDMQGPVPFTGPGEGKRRTGMFTLLFTDIADSTRLKASLGDQAGVGLIQSHHQCVRDLLAQFEDAREINTAGDSFLIVFGKPSDALRFAVRLGILLRDFNRGKATPVQDRIGLHMGEVVIEEKERRRDVHGMQVDTCARVMSLAQAGQILMTRPVFDNARQSLKGEEIEGVTGLEWLNHGRFELKGVDEPVEICEVRASDSTAMSAPTTSEKARRVEAAEGEAVLGWRPAVGSAVPNTQWLLEQKLGEGGFGEVWLGHHPTLKQRRVFKFCFRADRVRALKREVTLFRLLQERIGEHPNVVRLYEVFFDHPPYYLEEEYLPGRDLRSWCEARGGVAKVPMETRLELVAQAAEGLQAAHDAGIIHRDVKPGNILVSEVGRGVPSAPSTLSSDASGAEGTPRPTLQAKLTDFGIGQVVSAEALAGVTKAGFTETLMSPGSSSQTGTHVYMAPELMTGSPASTRSDIYSLGVVLYQLAVADFKRPVTTDWAADISDPLLREDLQHCFAGDPQNRFAGAALLARNLRSLPQRRTDLAARQEAERRAARRRLIGRATLAASLALIVVACALGYGLKRAREEALKARRIAYASDMNVGWRSLEENNLDQVIRLLKAQTPEPGQEDLRNWEWRYLWQQSRGEQDWVLRPPGAAVLGLATLPGKRLALGSGGPEGRVCIWDLERREVVRVSEFTANISGLAASPDGRFLAVAAWEHLVRILDASTLEVIKEFRETKGVWRVHFSPKGNLLVASGDRDLSVWDLTDAPTRLWTKPSGHLVSGAVFEPTADSILCLIEDGTTARMDARNGTVLSTNFPAFGPASLCVSQDGRLAARGHWRGFLCISDLVSSQSSLLTTNQKTIYALAFSPDRRKLAFAGANPVVRVLDVESGELTAQFRGHGKTVRKIAFSEDGRQLFSASDDGTVRCWSLEVSPESAHGVALPRGIQQGDVGHFGKWPVSRNACFFAARQTNDSHRIFDLRTFREVGWAHFPADYLSLALRRDGKLAAAGSWDGTVLVWDTEADRASYRFTAHTNPVTAMDFSPDGTHFATIGEGGEVRVWTLGKPAPERSWTLAVPGYMLHDLAFTPDGNGLVVPGWGQLHLLSLTPGKPDRSTHSEVVYSVDISQDGSLVAGAMNGEVGVWEVSSLRKVASLRGTLGDFTSAVSLSPDGRRVLAGDSEGVIWLWDLVTQRELGRFGPSIPFYAHFQEGGDTIILTRGPRLEAIRAPTWKEIAEAEQADAQARQLWLKK